MNPQIAQITRIESRPVIQRKFSDLGQNLWNLRNLRLEPWKL
jgi:hypothetical protein